MTAQRNVQTTQVVDNSDGAIRLSFFLPAGGVFPTDLRVQLICPVPGQVAPVVLEDLASNVARALSGITGAQAANFLKDCRNSLLTANGFA